MPLDKRNEFNKIADIFIKINDNILLNIEINKKRETIQYVFIVSRTYTECYNIFNTIGIYTILKMQMFKLFEHIFGALGRT